MKKRNYFVLGIICFCIMGCNQRRFDAVTFFIDSGNFEKAELILKNMNKREKESFAYNYLSGIILIKKSISGYKRDALNLFLKANEYNSNNYLNNLMISKMYIEVNDLTDAEIFALKAKGLFSEKKADTVDDDVYYLLARIYLKKKDYDKALVNINSSSFQSDKHIVFLKTEIADLKGDTNLLDALFNKYRNEGLFSDEIKFDYMNYLFLKKRINDAEKITDEFKKEESPLLNYYGCLFKAFILMLNKDFEKAQSYIEKSYDYTVDDPLFLSYKMKLFYAYLTEKDPIKIFNSFLIYKFLYEKNDMETITAEEDLSEIYEYFKDDIYFNLLKETV